MNDEDHVLLSEKLEDQLKAVDYGLIGSFSFCQEAT